ncbi:MAG TPA: hypothetical protein G4N96_07465 [Chloroflexi bacterium]|nr:hypothetical protein [Chloroflexota bacterium]
MLFWGLIYKSQALFLCLLLKNLAVKGSASVAELFYYLKRLTAHKAVYRQSGKNLNDANIKEDYIPAAFFPRIYKNPLLTKHKMLASMSRKGNCYDNAPMDGFFGALKTKG